MGYGDNFVDAIGFLYDAFSDVGADIIGFTSTEGYEFKRSKGTIDDQFMGLALDEDNQKDLSEARLSAWIADISTAWQ